MFASVMQGIRRHSPRPIRFVEVWTMDDWQVKIYTIAENGETIDELYIQKAKEIAKATLGKLQSDTHHGFAFVTIHIASMFNQIIVDWWAMQNELRHLVFKANPEAPHDFSNITCTGEAFCVWELEVIGFERDTWMEHVLSKSPPSVEGYLAASLNADI